MTFKQSFQIFLLFPIAHLQNFRFPSNLDTVNFEEQEVKDCNTIESPQGDFKVHVRDSGKKPHKDCVSNMVLEKDGKKFCISDKGDDDLQCKSGGKNKINRTSTQENVQI